MKKTLKTLVAFLGTTLLAGCGGKEIYNHNNYYTFSAVSNNIENQYIKSLRTMQYSGEASHSEDETTTISSYKKSCEFKYEFDFVNLKAHVHTKTKTDYVNSEHPSDDSHNDETADYYLVYDYTKGMYTYRMTQDDFVYYPCSNSEIVSMFTNETTTFAKIYGEDYKFEDCVRMVMLQNIMDLVGRNYMFGDLGFAFMYGKECEFMGYSDHGTDYKTIKSEYDIDTKNMNIKYNLVSEYGEDWQQDYNFVGDVSCKTSGKIESCIVLEASSEYQQIGKEYEVYDSENPTYTGDYFYTSTTKITNTVGQPTFADPDFSLAVLA